ncbi:PREDICTED: cardiomyopathy-associated protein 5 [Crocodylus porosus]|uniref:cardiomyopathy-associated protein 5 n=1 Tax=Crocodylus porosus TaxID=8502 RepID=UPI00093AFBE7|nr:PREDICTED: cardiomyopathy-associated protein 5 [Crocodylus porosus]
MFILFYTLKDLIQNAEVKPKLQYIVSNPSFSMVTIPSEDSGITWETSSSRCSAPWASEPRSTSYLYSLESSSVGCPPGKVIFIMDDGKTVRKKICRSSDRTLLHSNLKEGQGSKKRDFSGMQDLSVTPVNDTELSAAEPEAKAMEVETSKDKEDPVNITEEPTPLLSKSMGKENKQKKGGPDPGGSIWARIQKFNSITEEATPPKLFRKTRSKDPPILSDTKREQRQRKGFLKQSLSSPSSASPEKASAARKDASLLNIKCGQLTPGSMKFSNSNVPLDNPMKKEMETPSETSEQSRSISPCLTEEGDTQEVPTCSPTAINSILGPPVPAPLDHTDKSGKQEMWPPPVETIIETSDQSLPVTSCLTDEVGQQEIQPYSIMTTEPISAESVTESEQQTTQAYSSVAPEYVSDHSVSLHLVEEAEKQGSQSYSPMTTQSESEHSVLSETKKQDVDPYSSTTAESELDHAVLSCSVDEAEKQESQFYSPLTTQSECEHPDVSNSADETEEQETTQLESGYLEKQVIQPHSPVITQSESEHPYLSEYEEQKIKSYSTATEQLASEQLDISCPIDEMEIQKRQFASQVTSGLCEYSNVSDSSGKEEREETAQLESKHLEMQDSGFHSLVTKQRELDVQKLTCLSHEAEEQETTQMEPEQPNLAHSMKKTEYGDIQPCLPIAQSDSEHLDLAETELEVNPYSPKTTAVEDKQKVQADLLSTKYLSEQLSAHSPSLIAESIHQEMPGKQEMMNVVSEESSTTIKEVGEQNIQFNSLANLDTWLEESKSYSLGFFDEKEKKDIPSSLPDLVSMLVQQSKTTSVSCNEETNRREMEPCSDGTEDVSLGQSTSGSPDLLDERAMQKHQPSSAEVDSIASAEPISTLLSPSIKTQNLEMPSYSAEAEETHPSSNVEEASKEPEHGLQREEELTHHVKSEVESKCTSELDSQKDMFNIISEGYEILNIHVPPVISSIDQEESKHMPDKLEYLETNTLWKRQLVDYSDDTVAGHKASVCGTTTEISESSVASDTGSKDNEQKELVKDEDAPEAVETKEEISKRIENNSETALNPNNTSIDMDYFEKYTLIDDKSPTESSPQELHSFPAGMESPKEPMEEAVSLNERSDVNTLEDGYSLFNYLDEAFYGTVEEDNKIQSCADVQKSFPEQKSVDISGKKIVNVEDERKSAGTPLFDTEEGVLERSLLFPTSVTMINPELLEEPPALSFLYKDLYEEAVGENIKGDNEPLSDEESMNSDASFPSRNSDTDDGTGIYFEKYILIDDIPSNMAGFQKEQIPKDQSSSKDISSQTRVSEDRSEGVCEAAEKESQSVHISAEESAKMSEGKIVERETDVLRKEEAQIVSDIKATICKPAYAIPFGSKLNISDARNDVTHQRREEENIPAEANQELSGQTSHQESSQLVDSEEIAHQDEASVLNKSKEVTYLTDEQKKQHEITDHKMDNDLPHGRTPAEGSKGNQYVQENLSHVETLQQTEKLEEDGLISHLDKQLHPMTREAHALEYNHLENMNKKKGRGENLIGTDELTHKQRGQRKVTDGIAQHDLGIAKCGLSEPEVRSDYALSESDTQPFPCNLDNLQPSSGGKQCFGAYEDLAESMDYEVINQEELQDEVSSELAHEELLFEDRESFEHISDSYEFVNEAEQVTPTDREDSGFVMMEPEQSSADIPESESPQKEMKKAQIDTYCYQCRCTISAIDKLFGQHKEHDVTSLDTAANEIKDQLDEFLVALQEKSLKIEEFVSEIESLFNSVEENCKKSERVLEDQNEDMVKKVTAQYDEKLENFEEVKKMKMEYLYEQMVNFQQIIDAAKEALGTTVRETEELDEASFLNSSKEMNKRLLSAMDNTLSLEKLPSAFSLFQHYADSPVQSDQKTLNLVPVPQTPKLKPQEPNSATSTSVAVYWTVNEGDIVDYFQVYCMEEPQANKEQSALVEEYRVTVKESHCILEDLEPDRCYSVWVMAVNYTGCSLPSDKSTFKTAPSTPLIKAEDCTVCWDTATIRWSSANSEATESFTLEYCRQYSPEGEGLRSFAGIRRPELKVYLQPNVNYFFYVRAANAFGTSEQSEAALISTKGTRFHFLSDTIHPALQVLSDEMVICLSKKTKFTGMPSVLGELLPARGLHYWETTTSACSSYRIGICYGSTPQGSILGLSDSSWCICCCSTHMSFVYKFFHNGIMSTVHVTEPPARVGILLDYDVGRLLFFNAERGLVLFSIRHKFTEDAHPAFVLEKPGVLNVHTGMELPGFVEHS